MKTCFVFLFFFLFVVYYFRQCINASFSSYFSEVICVSFCRKRIRVFIPPAAPETQDHRFVVRSSPCFPSSPSGWLAGFVYWRRGWEEGSFQDLRDSTTYLCVRTKKGTKAECGNFYFNPFFPSCHTRTSRGWEQTAGQRVKTRIIFFMCVCVCFLNKTSYKNKGGGGTEECAELLIHKRSQSLWAEGWEISAQSEEELSNDIIHMQIYSNTNVLRWLEDLRGIFFFFFCHPRYLTPRMPLPWSQQTQQDLSNLTRRVLPSWLSFFDGRSLSSCDRVSWQVFLLSLKLNVSFRGRLQKSCANLTCGLDQSGGARLGS